MVRPLIILLMVVGAFSVLLALQVLQAEGAKPITAATAKRWVLISKAFMNNERIPAKYTCEGVNVSPVLSWTAPPEGTVELALVCHDPDAPVGDFTHWVLYGLPASRMALPEGVRPTQTLPNLGSARQGRNGFGKIGYGGPCPPKGPAHHYHFRLYALSRVMSLQPGVSRAQLMRAMQGKILGETELVGLYARR